MKKTLALCATACFAVSGAHADVFDVAATANLWLADAAPGTQLTVGGQTDTAPAQSPVEVLLSGAPESLFFGVTGEASNGGAFPLVGPDGDQVNMTFFSGGPTRGISGVGAPRGSLIGVFLNNDNPELTQDIPFGLNFTNPANRDQLAFSPRLNQVFFIGDGLTTGGDDQEFVVPDGATRLFLGVMDNAGWNNNVGGFTVNVIPAPASLAIASLAGGMLMRRRRRA